MKYMYGCDVLEHGQIEVQHGMNENPDIMCNVCDRPMHRVPQTFTWGHNPGALLLDKLSERHRINKIRASYKRKYAKSN